MTDADLSAEDAKLVTLARATRARTGAAEGAAVRDLDGRTYAAASVALASLSLTALEVCVAMAIASGSRGLEAAVVLTRAGGRRRRWPPSASSPGPTSPCTSGDPRGTLGEHAAHLSRVHPSHPCRGCRASSDRYRGLRAHGARSGPITLPAWRGSRGSYAALPPGAPVRLAKRTSNLFRAAVHDRAGPRRLRASTGVIEVDGDVAEVQGMCTYEHLVEVTLQHGRIPLRRPAAAHHHPGRRGDRARHRVDQLPPRPAARVGARDGRPHRRRARS